MSGPVRLVPMPEGWAPQRAQVLVGGLPVPEIRLLSLTQPWASLVALGLKRIETRSWGTRYRGPVAIHAAKGFPHEAQSFAEARWLEGRLPLRAADLPLGCILGVEYLSDILATEDAATRITAAELRFGDYTPGRKAWLFDPEQHRPLATPFPYRGAQGLRRLPPDIASRLLEHP